MKTLCPICFNETPQGCENCDETGYVEAYFPIGVLFTRYCRDCKFENGGKIVNSKYPLLPNLTEKWDVCVVCKSPNVCWKYIGDKDED